VRKRRGVERVANDWRRAGRHSIRRRRPRERSHSVSAIQQCADHCATEISGAASDEYVHNY
jgi:hypothetical protein